MNNPAIIAKINEIQSYPTLTDWSRGFCESITVQIEKGSKLSAKQMEVLTKIFNENSEEEVSKLENWSSDYEIKYAQTGTILAGYYESTPYFRDVVSDIKSGKVPDRRSFLKMLDNKYAHKVIEESQRPAKYSIGDYMLGNAACSHQHLTAVDSGRLGRHIYNDFRQRGGFVVGISSLIKSAAKGAKRYKILPIGTTVSFWVEERHMKKAPKPKAPNS